MQILAIITSSKTPLSYFERVQNLAQTYMMYTKLNELFGQNAIDVMKKKFGEDFDVNVSHKISLFMPIFRKKYPKVRIIL